MDYEDYFRGKPPAVFREFAIAICELLLEREWPAGVQRAIAGVLDAVRSDDEARINDAAYAANAAYAAHAADATINSMPDQRDRVHALVLMLT